MAIQCVNGYYIVTIKGRGRAPLLIDAAETRDQARELETAMIAALDSTGTWPPKRPAPGTLAAVLRDAWRRPDGWHSKRTGAILYAFALEFVTFMGADRMAEEITEDGLASYLSGNANADTASRAILQLLQTASDSGAVSWRPVRRKGLSNRCPIALLTAHATTRTKIVPVANPTRSGPLWEMVEVKRKAWR